MPPSPAFFNYIIAMFFIVFIAACALNLLKQHYIYQLVGIAFFFVFFTFRLLSSLKKGIISLEYIISLSLVALSGISACLAAMALGFWIFPLVRNRFRD